MSEKTQKYLAVVRIAFGFLFLWAFVDKVFGLGFATKPEMSVLNGASATAGYLSKGTSGAFAEVFQNLATSAAIEWLFLAGLLLLGIAFLLGVGMRLAVWGGVLFMALLWLTNFPPKNNPILDDHVLYALTILAIGQAKAGDVFGFGIRWKNTALVRSIKLLE
jgi:thiosulfate dehydrogenase (quinone) large subunit